MAYLNCYLSKRTEVRVILVEKEKVLALHNAPFQNVILLLIAYFIFWLINTDTLTQHVDAGVVAILTTVYTVQYFIYSIYMGVSAHESAHLRNGSGGSDWLCATVCIPSAALKYFLVEEEEEEGKRSDVRISSSVFFSLFLFL